MKKRIIYAVLLLISIIGLRLNANAQLFHAKGEKGFTINGMMHNNGNGIRIAYESIFKKRLKYSVGSEGIFSKEYATKDSKYSIDGRISYTITNIKQRIFFDGYAGVGVGIEHLKDRISGDKKDSFMVKEILGVRIEYCISERIYINLETRQNLYQLNRNGTGIFEFGLGITINL